MRLVRRRRDGSAGPWTPAQVERLRRFLSLGMKLEEIYGQFPTRTPQAVRSKIRKLRVKHGTFGASYRNTKTGFTKDIAKEARPKTVFEAYAGSGYQTIAWLTQADTVYCAELSRPAVSRMSARLRRMGYKRARNGGRWLVYRKEEKSVKIFLGDAVSAAAHVHAEIGEVDVLDLDTCGSTLPTLPTFLALLSPAYLVITHGEFHSLRLRRNDVLRRIMVHSAIGQPLSRMGISELAAQLDKAVKTAALRAHNETQDSFWPELVSEKWLRSRSQGMLRRFYALYRPVATADCLNYLAGERRSLARGARLVPERVRAHLRPKSSARSDTPSRKPASVKRKA